MPRYQVNSDGEVCDWMNMCVVAQFKNRMLADKYCECLNYGWFYSKRDHRG